MKKISYLWIAAMIVAASVVGCSSEEDIPTVTENPSPNANAPEAITTLAGSEWTYHFTHTYICGSPSNPGSFDGEMIAIYSFCTDSTGYYTFDLTDHFHPVEGETFGEIGDFKMMMDYSFDPTTGIITLHREDYEMHEYDNGIGELVVVPGVKSVEEELLFDQSAGTITNSELGWVYYRTK